MCIHEILRVLHARTLLHVARYVEYSSLPTGRVEANQREARPAAPAANLASGEAAGSLKVSILSELKPGKRWRRLLLLPWRREGL